MFKQLLVRTSQGSAVVRQQGFAFSKLNSHYIPNTPEYPQFTPKENRGPGLASNHRSSDWTLEEIKKSS